MVLATFHNPMKAKIFLNKDHSLGLLHFLFILASSMAPMMSYAFSFTLSTGGARETVTEKRLEKMQEPQVEIVNKMENLTKCQRIKELETTEEKEYWQNDSVYCERAIKRLKKLSVIEGGNTLFYKMDHRGCFKGMKVQVFRCDENRE